MLKYLSIDEMITIILNYIEDELKKIIEYTVYSAIRRTNGNQGYKWHSDVRYGYITNFKLKMQRQKELFGYKFVDEYWITQHIDFHIVDSDIKNIMAEEIALKKRIDKTQKHNSLALFHLENWYLLPDETVKQLIHQMEEELKQKEYYPQEFKDIIVKLMQINNPNFGLHPDKSQESNRGFFDSTKSDSFVGMSVIKPEADYHYYEDWKEIEISEFVNLMVEYFNNSEFILTQKMLRVISEDKQFVYNYRQLIMPLIVKIEQKELLKISENEMGILISKMKWDDTFEKYCNNNKSDFMDNGRFFSLFDYNTLTQKLIEATPMEINHFCNAIKKVYSFSNLADVYLVDYEMIEKIYNFISENIGTSLNMSKSRTKEIALRRLIAELNKYKYSLIK